MFLPTLLALATGVFPSGNSLVSSKRVIVFVKHPGPPKEFALSIRTKETQDEKWNYIRDVKHMPKLLRTNTQGRRVVLTLPSELKRWTQVCAFLPAEKPKGDGFQVAFSLESCSNLPDHKRFSNF